MTNLSIWIEVEPNSYCRNVIGFGLNMWTCTFSFLRSWTFQFPLQLFNIVNSHPKYYDSFYLFKLFFSSYIIVLVDFIQPFFGWSGNVLYLMSLFFAASCRICELSSSNISAIWWEDASHFQPKAWEIWNLLVYIGAFLSFY